MIKFKNNYFDIFVIVISLICLIEIVFNKDMIFNTVAYSLNLWVNSIIPSLFPFFIISNIMISYDAVNYIPLFIKKIFRVIFKVNDNILTLFFLSILSGFPSSGINTRLMYDRHMIDSYEASRALVFTHFANPLFILGTVGTLFLHNSEFGMIIMISHYIPNIILGIMTRSDIKNSCIKNNNYYNKISFPKIFIDSIKKAIDNLLLIVGTVTCFLVISVIITNIFNFDIYTESIIKGILEMTIGLKSIASLNIASIYKVVISSMILSFGGLSVHMQILSFIEDTNISYKSFFIARIYHSILSGVFAYILYYFFI